MFSALTNFTISAWIKPATLSNWQRVFDFGTGTTAYMFLTTDNGTAPRFAITTAGNGSEQQLNATNALTTGTWQHIAVTLSGTTGTLYVGGTSVATNASMTLNPSSLGSTNLNYIGESQWSGDPYFNGQIDDFRVYNRALSAAEISALAAQ
jgi:hypothetical protein